MKGLLVLALLVALLAIGNTAAAGPFGVNMGDPLKPDRGWNAKGYGSQSRKYKGPKPHFDPDSGHRHIFETIIHLPLIFDVITLEGTREHGVCRVILHGYTDFFMGEIEIKFDEMRDLLIDKYGVPTTVKREDRDYLTGKLAKTLVITTWVAPSNPDNIKRIKLVRTLSHTTRGDYRRLVYYFSNHQECFAGEL